MNPPRLLGNRGELGEFVLPLRNPNANRPVLWMTSPPRHGLDHDRARGTAGHELQFAAMVERGVSIARADRLQQHQNAEGWGLYAESIMIPYFPADGQLFALQLRLLRAARAFLDPWSTSAR